MFYNSGYRSDVLTEINVMADLTSKTLRVFNVTIDKYGIDPLLDKAIPEILKITNYKVHDITQDERGSPDLISLREYGTEDYWWVIMAYNGVGSYKTIIEGLSLKIPLFSQVVSVFTQSSMRLDKTQTITI